MSHRHTDQEMMLPPSEEACFAFLPCWAWQSLSTHTGEYKPIILSSQLHTLASQNARPGRELSSCWSQAEDEEAQALRDKVA